ncbi:helix-turn-helix domain-containing protein [Actinoplanes sp. CA-015351]|uniref:helix-turn-helix domain-containing protein n=1 Tax=Actinoplanes sp. CA-015351 TaxID=3239897 RepID=UPI003D9532B4
MTDDVRDRILGLLHSGPATVAGLSGRLELPGGVVSYHLKMLEQVGLVRVGGSRVERGVPIARYVSTAAAASPPLRIPVPLPGLTWTGTGRFPIPVWTVDASGTPIAAVGASGSAESLSASAEGASGSAEVAGDLGVPVAPGVVPATTAGVSAKAPVEGVSAKAPAESVSAKAPAEGVAGKAPAQRVSVEDSPRPDSGPRLAEIRRIPMDDATFYEFATRLDALTREFAARATADAPPAELAIALYRPPGEAAAGNGS